MTFHRIRIKLPVYGEANNTTVTSGGWIDVYGKMTGQMTFADGAVVSTYEGAVVDFDISDLSPNNTARLNNLSLVSGRNDANFTLTVSETQTNGTYTLAECASGFNKTITVQTGYYIAELSVGVLRSDGKLYALSIDNGDLSLYVGLEQYIVSSGEVSSGIILQYNSMTILNGGVTNSTTVNSDGGMS